MGEMGGWIKLIRAGEGDACPVLGPALDAICGADGEAGFIDVFTGLGLWVVPVIDEDIEGEGRVEGGVEMDF